MTTGSRAISQLADATGIMRSRIDRASVALQGADMWPMGARGGGRTTPHVDPEHLVNLTVAVACADPITSAAEAVRRYRPLILSRLMDDDKSETTFGALLDGLLLSTSPVMLTFVLDAEHPEVSILIADTVLTSPAAPLRPAGLMRTVCVPFGFFDVLRDILQE